MLEKYEVCRGLFHGFDWTPLDRRARRRSGCRCCRRRRSTSSRRRTARSGCCRPSTELSQGVRAGGARTTRRSRIRDDVGFFQAVRAVLAEDARRRAARPTRSSTTPSGRSSRKAVVVGRGRRHLRRGRAEEAGHLDPVRRVPGRGPRHAAAEPRRRAAAEAAQRRDQGARRKRNVVQARSFAEMLEQALRRYQNRAIETAQVIEELIELAKEMREASARGEELGLTEDELAFYDALEANDSAVKVLGDETLRTIARELVETVRQNVTIDWTVRENVRAQAARARQAHPAQARLPAGQAGEGDADGAGAGGSAVRDVGG